MAPGRSLSRHPKRWFVQAGMVASAWTARSGPIEQLTRSQVGFLGNSFRRVAPRSYRKLR
jgi:hypothetical protein